MAGLLSREAARRGIFGGSRGWTILWAVIVGAKLVRRMTADRPEVVFRQRLEPGAGVVIRNGDRPVTVLGAAEVRDHG